MEKDKHKIIFAHGKCISEDVLIAYANNTLNAKEKHAVEKHTLGCDMCADALEGIMMMKNPSQLKGITESLNKKIGGAGEERKPIILWMDTRVRVAIAAGLALLIGFFFLFNNSLNESSENKTVSDNMVKKGENTDSSVMNFEESKKADSVSSLHQNIVSGKEQDLDAKSKRLEKSGEVNVPDANSGPGWSATSHASDGDAFKSKDQRESKKDEAPAPPQDAQQQNGSTGFNDVTTVDRSKSVDDKKLVSQTEKKPNADEKDKEGKDDLKNVGGKFSEISTGTTNQPVPNTTVDNDKNVSGYYKSPKTDSPKKEEKEKVVSKDSGKKEKRKTTAHNESQKQPVEKSNKAGQDNYESTTAPQSTTVSGGAGNVSPNMVPQNNKNEQEITLSKEKQLSDDEDAYSKTDTLKFRSSMLDSTSNTSGLSSGEKKYADKDYNGAIIVFGKTLDTKPTDREALYKLGDSYLQLNKPDLAIVQFDKLIALGKGAYYDAARYDKSMALVKQNKNAEAKKLLLEIEQTSTEYKSRAKVQLDKVK